MEVNIKTNFRDIEQEFLPDQELLEMLEWHLLEDGALTLKYVQWRDERDKLADKNDKYSKAYILQLLEDKVNKVNKDKPSEYATHAHEDTPLKGVDATATNRSKNVNDYDDTVSLIEKERDLLAMLCARLALANRMYAGIENRDTDFVELFIELPDAGQIQYPIAHAEIIDVQRDFPATKDKSWQEFPGHRYDNHGIADRIERIESFLKKYRKELL